jgi:hypothetical protein
LEFVEKKIRTKAIALFCLFGIEMEYILGIYSGVLSGEVDEGI